MDGDRLRRQLTVTRTNRLSDAEIEQFLGERRVAYLATLRASGRVHLTPVWFWYEDESVYFLLGSGRRHLANLRASPAATLLVEHDMRLTDGWHAGARAVMISGDAAEITDRDTFVHVHRNIDRKYLGEDADDVAYHEAIDSDTFTMWRLPTRPRLGWRLG